MLCWCCVKRGNRREVIYENVVSGAHQVEWSTKADAEYALVVAASVGNVRVVQKLVEQQGIDPNTVDEESMSVLYLAAMAGHLEIVEILVKCQANINIQTKENRTPLMAAAWRGRLAVVQYLCGENAHVHCRDVQGFSALDLAKEWNHDQVVAFLKDLY